MRALSMLQALRFRRFCFGTQGTTPSLKRNGALKSAPEKMTFIYYLSSEYQIARGKCANFEIDDNYHDFHIVTANAANSTS